MLRAPGSPGRNNTGGLRPRSRAWPGEIAAPTLVTHQRATAGCDPVEENAFLPPPCSRVHRTGTFSMQEPSMKRNRWQKGRKRRQDLSLLERINPDVAGIDLGSTQHFVAVPTD